MTCLVAVGLLAVAGCKTNPAGKVPTTIPPYQFQPPDEDEVFPDEDTDTTDGDDADAADGN